MSNDPLSFWTGSSADARFSDPEACARRSTRFERTIRRRNLIESAAGGVVIVLFTAGAVAAASVGEWAFAAAGALVGAGTAFILWHLHRRGSNLVRRPEDDCRTHLLGQLARQRDLLRRVPQWYLAPLLPGICAVYGITAAKVAEMPRSALPGHPTVVRVQTPSFGASQRSASSTLCGLMSWLAWIADSAASRSRLRLTW